jgi:hypothetical protein
MANQNQLGGKYVHGGDVGYSNFGATDIPQGLVVLNDTSNPEQTDIADGVRLPTTSDTTTASRIAGITIDTLPALAAGFNGRVRKLGAAVTTANGTIQTGQKVTVSVTANKLGWVKAATTGDAVVGIAECDALDGDPIRVGFTAMGSIA